MDYVRLKESAIKLADLIKIIPKKDKRLLKEILQRYNESLYSYDNVDFQNTFFSDKEKRSISLIFNKERERIANEVIAKEIEEKYPNPNEWPDDKYKYYHAAWNLDFELDLITKNYIALLSRKPQSSLKTVARQTISNMIEIQFFKELNK